MIQQAAWVQTKRNQGRSSGFQLCNAGLILRLGESGRLPVIEMVAQELLSLSFQHG